MAADARSRTRAVLFDAGNTLLRMNYPAIARHPASRGHAVTVEAVEEAELRARVGLDADLARGLSTVGRPAQDQYTTYLMDGLGFTDGEELAFVVGLQRGYNPPAR